MQVSKPNYESHQKYIQSIVNQSIAQRSFKQEPLYMEVLENVSKEYGIQYLQHIEGEFPVVTFDILRKYVNTNDKYGNANKTIFTTQDKKLLYCSPTSLRYLYHALILMDAFKLSGCRNMVELGSGYGGLYLAVQIVLPLFTDVTIDKYVMIDLPYSGALTSSYLKVHEEDTIVPYEIIEGIEASGTGFTTITPPPNNSFFVSNYCLSALSAELQTQYRIYLLDHCSHGWVTWQTCFGDSVETAKTLLGKPEESYTIVPEKPQTAPYFIENYWIYWNIGTQGSNKTS